MMLIFPAVSYPAMDLPTQIVEQYNLSQSYPTRNCSDRFIAIIEEDRSVQYTGSVRYGYGDHSPIAIPAGQGFMKAFTLQRFFV